MAEEKTLTHEEKALRILLSGVSSTLEGIKDNKYDIANYCASLDFKSFTESGTDEIKNIATVAQMQVLALKVFCHNSLTDWKSAQNAVEATAKMLKEF